VFNAHWELPEASPRPRRGGRRDPGRPQRAAAAVVPAALAPGVRSSHAALPIPAFCQGWRGGRRQCPSTEPAPAAQPQTAGVDSGHPASSAALCRSPAEAAAGAALWPRAQCFDPGPPKLLPRCRPLPLGPSRRSLRPPPGARCCCAGRAAAARRPPGHHSTLHPGRGSPAFVGTARSRGLRISMTSTPSARPSRRASPTRST